MKNYLLILLLIIVSSCKVSYSLNGADVCEQCKTVSIQFIENNASNVNPELSQKLTESIKEKFNSSTPLNLVQSNGDLDFSGFISTYQVTSVAASNSDLASMNRLSISISISYINIHEEEKNFEQTFSRFADFESSKNLNDVETELVDQIIEELVQDIFNKSVVNW